MTALPTQNHTEVAEMSPDTGDVLQANSPVNPNGSRPASTESAQLILRGWHRDKESGEFQTTLALFKKASENHMTGYALLEGQKIDVIAHINARMVDPDKPNYLVLRRKLRPNDPHANENLAYGNAVNSRRDGKPVYFDEVLFQFKDGPTIAARLHQSVPPELQRRLGFQASVLPRPSKDDPTSVSAADAPSKPDLAVATHAGDEPEAAPPSAWSKAAPKMAT